MKPRSLTAKTLLLAFGKILAAFAAIGITAILTRLLTIEDYATHKQAIMIFAMLAPPLTLGLPKALYFFLPGEKKRPRAILLENLSILFLCGAVMCAILLFGGGDFFAGHFENERLLDVIPLVAIYGLCMLPVAAFSPTMMATDHVATLVRFQIGTQATLLVCVGFAAYFFQSPIATVSAYTIWAVIALSLAMVFMFRATFDSPEPRPTLRGMKTQLAYGIPLGLAAMFGSISTQVDKFMVSVMCSTQDFAVYVTGAVELPLIGVVTGAMNAVVLPELAKFFKAGQLESIISLWQRAMNKAILVLAPAMFVVLLFGSELIVFLFSSAYASAAVPFKIYALSLPLRAAVYGSVLMATNRTKLVTIAALFGLATNATLNWLFVNWFGYSGAAWASVATTYCVVFVMLVAMSKALKVRIYQLFDWLHLTKVGIATFTPAIPLYVLMDAAPVAGLAKLILGAGIYGVTVLVMYRILGIATPQDILNFLRRRSS